MSMTKTLSGLKIKSKWNIFEKLTNTKIRFRDFNNHHHVSFEKSTKSNPRVWTRRKTLFLIFFLPIEIGLQLCKRPACCKSIKKVHLLVNTLDQTYEFLPWQFPIKIFIQFLIHFVNIFPKNIFLKKYDFESQLHTL